MEDSGADTELNSLLEDDDTAPMEDFGPDDDLPLNLDEVEDDTSKATNRIPFKYVYGTTPPAPPWKSSTNLAKNELKAEPSKAEKREKPSMQMSQLAPSNIDSSGFTALESRTLKLDAIVPASVETDLRKQKSNVAATEKTEGKTKDSANNSAWQSRD